jgi:hypothetical protein
MSKSSTGRWAIIIGLAFATALVLAILVLQHSWGNTTTPTVAYLPDSFASGTSARQAFPPAAAAALLWQADAQPAAAMAHWKPIHGRWPGRVTWVFHFYSPETHRLAVISVTDGQAYILREALSPYRLDVFAQDDWQVDSAQALSTWWAAGGGDFLHYYPEADLAIQLRATDEGTAQLVWTITGIAGEQLWIVSVNGTTGEQLQVPPAEEAR